MESKLVDKVRWLLKNRLYGITFQDLAEATSLPADWIRKVQHGEIKEPSCPRIEKLYNHLSDKKLRV